MGNITWSAEGAWVWNNGSSGHMKFKINYNPTTSAVTGSSSDDGGAFSISGTFKGNQLQFTKRYPSWQWEYHGTVSQTLGTNSYRFTGTWGNGRQTQGTFHLTVKPQNTGSASSATASSNLDGQWEGQYRYNSQPHQVDPPMKLNFTTFNETKIKALGNDGVGIFALEGKVSKTNGVLVVDMTKTYTTGLSWKYHGKVSSNRRKLTGTWGPTKGGATGSFELEKSF